MRKMILFGGTGILILTIFALFSETALRKPSIEGLWQELDTPFYRLEVRKNGADFAVFQNGKIFAGVTRGNKVSWGDSEEALFLEGADELIYANKYRLARLDFTKTAEITNANKEAFHTIFRKIGPDVNKHIKTNGVLPSERYVFARNSGTWRWACVVNKSILDKKPVFDVYISDNDGRYNRGEFIHFGEIGTSFRAIGNNSRIRYGQFPIPLPYPFVDIILGSSSALLGVSKMTGNGTCHISKVGPGTQDNDVYMVNMKDYVITSFSVLSKDRDKRDECISTDIELTDSTTEMELFNEGHALAGQALLQMEAARDKGYLIGPPIQLRAELTEAEKEAVEIVHSIPFAQMSYRAVHNANEDAISLDELLRKRTGSAAEDKTIYRDSLDLLEERIKRLNKDNPMYDFRIYKIKSGDIISIALPYSAGPGRRAIMSGGYQSLDPRFNAVAIKTVDDFMPNGSIPVDWYPE